MSFHSASNFEEMKRDLSELFVSTAAQFAKNLGFESFDRAALHQMSTALDDVAGEVLMFGADVWPDSAKDEVAGNVYAMDGFNLDGGSSALDAPVEIQRRTALLYTFGTLLVTTPLSFLLSAIAPHGGSLFYAFGVMAVSMVFGTRYALVLAVLSPVLHNLFDVVPSLTLTMPEKAEIVCAIFYFATAVGMPWAIRSSLKLRRRLGQLKPPAPPQPGTEMPPAAERQAQEQPMAIAA